MKMILLAVWPLFFAFTPAGNEKQYCNGRFAFCVVYPNDFVAQGESANGDGQVFISGDNEASITVYGSLAVDEFSTLSQRFAVETKEIKITYQLKKDNWFVFSGTDKNGMVVYMKTFKKTIDPYHNGATDVFQTCSIIYPPARQEKYKAYCEYIAGTWNK